MDPLAFLDGEEPVATTAADPKPAEAAPPADTPPADGQPRQPDGKFAPKAKAEDAAPAADPAPQAPATPPEAVAANPEPAKPPEGFVPLAALQAVREELNQFKRQVQQPAQPPPDPYEDFEAYEQHRQGQIAQERAEWSRQLAEARHGAELVQEAQKWAFERFDADPVFAQAAAGSRDPYGFAIAEYQRHQALSLLSDPANLAKFQAFLSGQAPPQAASQPAPAVAPPPQPSPPPRSIASAPNAGAAKPGEVQPGSAFDMVFKD